MQVKLTQGEQARLRYTTTHNVEAWTYWAQGMSHYRQAVTKEKMGRGRHYWEKALALDLNSASLNAMLGFMQCLDAGSDGGTTAKLQSKERRLTPTERWKSISAMPALTQRQASFS